MFHNSFVLSGALLALTISLALPVPVHASKRTPLALPPWSGWQINNPTSTSIATDADGTSYASVVNPAGVEPSPVGIQLTLPLDKLRGCQIGVTVEVRAKDVTKPQHTWNGVKAMVHVTSSSAPDTWDAAEGNVEPYPFSYDWKKLAFRTSIPAGATGATLIFGLQESNGRADFRNPTVTIMRPLLDLSKASPATGPIYTGHGPGALRGVMINPKMTASDIETLARWHVNLVRWQLTWNGFPFSPADTADAATYDKWLYGCLDHMDELLPAFHKAGIIVLIDLHTPPGGRMPDKVMRIFTDAGCQKHFGDLWMRIAERYKNDQRIWGYDLVNEPVLPGETNGLLDWHDLVEQTAKRVRTIDPNHAIIIEPDPWGSVSSLAQFEPVDVKGVVYSVHMYDPGQFTHQGVHANLLVGPVYPGVIGGVQWDKERIRKDFAPVAAYARATHSQIYVGEFSAIRWANGADRYISDVIDVMEENGWDWSYHAFREWQGWSPEVGEDKNVTTPAAAPTARLLILQKAFARNRAETTKIVKP